MNDASKPAPVPSAGPPGGVPPLLAYLPVGWLAVVVIFSLRGVVSSFPFLFDHDLPADVSPLIYGNVAAGIVTIVWGLYPLGLALARSPRFAAGFVPWQVFALVCAVLREAYVLLVPAFVFSLSNTAIAAVEIALGLFCIQLVRRGRDITRLNDRPAGARRPPLVRFLITLLGILAGGAIGFGAGLAAGAGISEATDMSCFEGACGFFAFFVGLAGLVAGAIGGGLFSFLRSGRPVAATA